MPRYSETEKAEVLALVDEIGAKKASEQKNIAYQTVLAWRNKRDVVGAPEDLSELVVEESAQLAKAQQQEGSEVTIAEQLRDSRRQIAALLAENERLKDAIDALIGRKS